MGHRLAHTGLPRGSVVYASLKARRVSGPPRRSPGFSPHRSSVASSSLHLSVGVYVLVLIREVGQVKAEWGLGPLGALSAASLRQPGGSPHPQEPRPAVAMG